ncbi:hypothetical protein F4861DRAFT_139844 [Xylaria intraflava]|nr:hypothetical protein F4861DRAFT_139844 [Xylaria intraflava]
MMRANEVRAGVYSWRSGLTSDRANVCITDNGDGFTRGILSVMGGNHGPDMNDRRIGFNGGLLGVIYLRCGRKYLLIAPHGSGFGSCVGAGFCGVRLDTEIGIGLDHGRGYCYLLSCFLCRWTTLGRVLGIHVGSKRILVCLWVFGYRGGGLWGLGLLLDDLFHGALDMAVWVGGCDYDGSGSLLVILLPGLFRHLVVSSVAFTADS